MSFIQLEGFPVKIFLGLLFCGYFLIMDLLSSPGGSGDLFWYLVMSEVGTGLLSVFDMGLSVGGGSRSWKFYAKDDS